MADTNKIQIRSATPEDAPVLARIFREVHDYHADLYPEEFASDVSESFFENHVQSLQARGAFVILAHREDIAVGFAIGLFREPQNVPVMHMQRKAFIDTLGVTATARREGVGRKLVEAIEDWANEKGAMFLELNVMERNEKGRAFWTEIGFACQRHAMRKELRQSLLADSFGRMLATVAPSPVFEKLCEAVNGIKAPLLRPLIREELDFLCRHIAKKEASRVLDVGTGAGAVAELIADATGAQVLGIDMSWKSVRVALERTRARRDRLDFRVCDLRSAEFLGHKFDFIVCLDSTAFLPSLGEALESVKQGLAPGGSALFTYFTWPTQHPTPEAALPENTPLGEALEGKGFRFRTAEFSEEHRRDWLRFRDALNRERDAFLADGTDSPSAWDSLLAEAEEMAAAVTHPEHSKRAKRYLYVATLD